VSRWFLSAVVAVVVSACEFAVPTNDAVVAPTSPAPPTVVTTQGSDGFAFTVTPWPFDQTTAYLCIDAPGAEFTVANPVPRGVADCALLPTSQSGDVLVARFPRALAEGKPIRFDRPRYLALAGSRGADATAVILTVSLVASPQSSFLGTPPTMT
jgi:hypothetical protein